MTGGAARQSWRRNDEATRGGEEPKREGWGGARESDNEGSGRTDAWRGGSGRGDGSPCSCSLVAQMSKETTWRNRSGGDL